jgi:C-terminal processing protease CtpA/Prc
MRTVTLQRMLKRFHLKSSAHFRNCAIAVFAAVTACVSPALAQDDFETRLKTIVDAYAAVELNAADPVTADQAFYQGAIPGLLRNLDPHSVFFTPTRCSS